MFAVVACAFADGPEGEFDAEAVGPAVEGGAGFGETDEADGTAGEVGAAGDFGGAAGGGVSGPSVVRRVRLVFDAGVTAGGFGPPPDPPRLCAGFGSDIEKTCDGAFACVTGTVVIFTRGANGFAGFFGGGGEPSPSAGFCGSGGAGLFGSDDTRDHELQVTLVDDK